MRKIEKQRFEFLLLINGNIICQRYFDIRNYNEDSINSMEMKELVDRMAGMNNGVFGSMGLIPDYLKQKSRDYLWGYYKPYVPQKVEDINRRDIYAKDDNFTFQIKIDEKIVGETQFTGDVFPPKVKYQVIIRDIIPEIISDIRYYLSKKSYTESYGDITLKSELAPYDFEV